MSRFHSNWIEREYFYEKVGEDNGVPHYAQKLRPLVVCLIGSSRFKEEHEKIQAELGLAGEIGIPLSQYGHLTGLDMDGPVKKELDILHLKKIDLADVVFVVNPGGYIGESTRRELEYARKNGKTLRSLEPLS